MIEGQSSRRGLLVDVALAVAVSTVLGVAIATDLGGRAPGAPAYLFALGLGALMFVRRQFPVLALLATAAGLMAYYAADYPPVGLALPVAAALYSAAEAGKLVAAIATAAALVLLSTVFRLREGDDAGYLLGFELASTIGLMATAIALGAGVRASRQLRAEQRRTAEQAAAERENEALRRVEEERLRIARDLHDVLAHTVAVVSVQADVASESLTEDPDAARAALATIRAASDEAVYELRSTLGLLRGPNDAQSRAPTGSLRQLDALVAKTVESGLPVRVSVTGEQRVLPTVVDTTAYRIVQEALTNSLRHAQASGVELTLRFGQDSVDISVTDDGQGTEVRQQGGGLRGMRERAALLGGSVETSSRPGNGFRVDVSLPLEVGG